MDLPIRPRRNRKTPSVRAMVRETNLSPGDFIYPLFLHEGNEDQPIVSMPGCTRWSLAGLVKEAGEAHALGIPAVALFPALPESRKSPRADEAWNERGLVPEAIRALKASHPSLCVITDVALDPYNSDGHDGIVRRNDVAGWLFSTTKPLKSCVGRRSAMLAPERTSWLLAT